MLVGIKCFVYCQGGIKCYIIMICHKTAIRGACVSRQAPDHYQEMHKLGQNSPRYLEVRGYFFFNDNFGHFKKVCH